MLRLSVPLGTFLLAFLFGGPACYAQQQDSIGAERPTEVGDEWVGTRYPPMPDGVTLRGGDSMYDYGSSTEDSPNENYSMSIVDARGWLMVWMDRVVGWTSEGRAKAVVTDVLVLPEISEDYVLEFGSICGTFSSERAHVQPEPSDVTYDPEIVAVLRRGKAKVLTHARRAWRADRDAGRFEEIDPEGIVCLNDALVGH